jgi:hypothetical protein
MSLLRASDRVFALVPYLIGDGEPRYVHVTDKTDEVLGALADVYLLDGFECCTKGTNWHTKHLILDRAVFKSDAPEGQITLKVLGVRDDKHTIDSLANNLLIVTAEVDIEQARDRDLANSEDDEDDEDDFEQPRSRQRCE